jgi:hypothetical protein
MNRRKFTELRRVSDMSDHFAGSSLQAAIIVCVPCRKYSLVQLCGFAARRGVAKVNYKERTADSKAEL